MRRCVGDKGRLCTIDSDCPNGDACRPYCDCDDPSNSICEVRGPEEAPRCIRGPERCTNNADCGLGSLHCVRFASPPLPLSAANTPLCLLTYFEEDITGTMDTQTGELRLRAVLRAQPSLGISNEMPCSRCGAPEARPTPGEPFTCDGGPKNGFPCTVDAVSRVFGGMSYDCPPYVSLATIGPGISIRLPDITTGETARTANLPWLSPYPFCTAVWASTGLTEMEPQLVIDRAVVQGLFATSPSPRLGDLILAATAATDDPDVRSTWVLIGDPTMRVR